MSYKLIKKLKKGDIVIYLLVFSVSIIIFLQSFLFGKSGTAYRVEIISENGKHTYSLSENRKEELKSNGYRLDIITENGKVWVENAQCPDKCCQNRGKISDSGDSIVCLPAKCVISIIGEGDADANAG